MPCRETTQDCATYYTIVYEPGGRKCFWNCVHWRLDTMQGFCLLAFEKQCWNLQLASMIKFYQPGSTLATLMQLE